MSTETKQTQEEQLQEEFEIILEGFSRILVAKLMQNEKKHKFGFSWKKPDWEEQLQREIVKHVEKGDPRDVAIYAMFAWFHNWRTAPEEEADWQLEARTERNLNLIDSFTNHLKESYEIEIPEEAVLSFFDA